MLDKRDITIGVVYDYDEILKICHRLRAIEFGLTEFVDGVGACTDDSDSAYGLQFMLCEIIGWLTPKDALTVDAYLKEIEAREALDQQQQVPVIQAAVPIGLHIRQAAANG